MRDSTTPSIMFAFLLLGLMAIGYAIVHDQNEYMDNYGPGSVVTTTTEYEYLTNDSFTGVVVSMAPYTVTVRNRGGEERQFDTKFLQPVE